MNEKIKVVIIDDETRSRFVMKTLIEKHFPEIEIAGEASDADEAHVLIQRVQPQLVFLDIQMPRGDGFGLLKRFSPVPFEVIFVTSYDKYAITAIKFSALDYLLKPVEISDLARAVKKAKLSIRAHRDNQSQIIHLLHSMEEPGEVTSIAVHTADAVRIILTASIVSVAADGQYCIIQTDQNERFLTARTLRDFDEYFGENSPFVRIGKSQIINAKKILKYTKGEPCMIEMRNGELFEVSRRRKPDVLNKLKGI